MIVDVRSVQLSLRDASGAISFQPDYYGAGPTELGDKAAGNAYPSALPWGLISRPMDPSGSDPANLDACEVILFEGPDEGRAMPTTDPRYLSVQPDTGAGGAGLVAVTDDGSHKDATSFLLAGQGLPGVTAGSVFLRVPYATGTKAHLLQVDLGTGKIRLVHGDGPMLEMTTTNITLSIGGTPVIDLSSTAAAFSLPTVQLAGAGGQNVVVNAPSLVTFMTNVASALTGLGVPISPPVGYTSTKATA